MNDVLRDVLSRLDAVQEVRKGWKARCPAHDDSDPSLLVSEGDKHPVTVHCFAGCLMEDITRAIGMQPADFCEDDSDLERTIKQKERQAPRPSRELSDEEWDRRAQLYFRMTWGELIMLDVYRRRRIEAREARSRERFDFWRQKEATLYDDVENRLTQSTTPHA